MIIDGPPCGLDVALAVMGGKWKPLILYHLRAGPERFGEIKRKVTGISEKVLIQQLRGLVADRRIGPARLPGGSTKGGLHHHLLRNDPRPCGRIAESIT